MIAVPLGMSLRHEAELRPHARVGTTIAGAWRIDALLGMGGMAAVYAATHTSGRKAAFKVLHRRLSADEVIAARFAREHEIAKAIDHPARVRIDALGRTDDGAPFLMMELLDGYTLDAIVALLGPFPVAAALVVADRLLDLLAACHARGVVHRDLKTPNVLITRSGEVKVLDFGVARLSDQSCTRPKIALGTPGTMAPEQARGLRDLDGRVDVFAVGGVLFSLLSGEPIRWAESCTEAVRDAATKPIRSLAVAAPDVPADVVSIVDTALAFDRERRWPDAETMRCAIAAVLSEIRWSPCVLTHLLELCEHPDLESSERVTISELTTIPRADLS